MPDKAIEVSFTFERETKNTYRYAEDGDDAVIGTLYIKKTAFTSKVEKLVVTIKEG